MGDRLEIEEEYDCRYEGLDYDGVDFGPVAVFGKESCSSQEEQEQEDSTEEVQRTKPKEQQTIQGDFLIKCHKVILSTLVKSVPRVSEVACHKAAALILEQVALCAKASKAKCMGANLLSKCRHADESIECENDLYDLLKLNPIEEKDVRMEIQKSMNQIRFLTPHVQLTSANYAVMFRLAAMPVTSSILKEFGDIGPYLRSLRKDAARPNLAAISSIVLDTWKLLIRSDCGKSKHAK
eukprot:jgi/Picsp_1/1109/NSC_04592-R1_---NA---